MIVLRFIELILKYAQEPQTQFLVLFLLIAGFFIFHFTSESVKRLLLKHHSSQARASFYGYSFQRILGFITYGMIPAIIIIISYSPPITKYGLNFENILTSLIWIGILSLIIIIANYYFARKPQNLKNYPQIRMKKWTTRKFFINILTWTLYLLGYEFMFRGLLLFSFYYAYGIIPAIMVNCLLYSLVHIPKGKKETIGAIPLGLILSLITLHTGSFLVAFIFHIIMALSNDYFAIKAHGSMSFQKK
jgi:membrane protease YdiL (CAAX protease family)